jgi:hypothetical protein
MAGLKARSATEEVRGGLKDELVGFLAGEFKIIEAKKVKATADPCLRQAGLDCDARHRRVEGRCGRRGRV